MNETRLHELSPSAETVWVELDEVTRRAMRKTNPFRKERNETVRYLRARGVTISVLVEITGLCRNSILGITKQPKMTAIKDGSERDCQGQVDPKAAIQSLCESILRALN